MESPAKKFKTVMILAVMNDESKPIISKLSLQLDPNFINPFCECYTSKLNGLNLNFYKPKKDPKYNVDSVGPEVASVTAYIGIQHCKPDILVNVGSCGGVAHDLRIGDVCVAKQGIGFFDREMIIPDYKAYQEGKYEIAKFDDIREKLGLKEVIVGSGCSFVSDQTLAESKNIHIAEMESAALGKVCFWMGVPFFVMKVVSDVNADEQTRAKMFDEQLEAVSLRLAGKLYEFLLAIDSI